MFMSIQLMPQLSCSTHVNGYVLPMIEMMFMNWDMKEEGAITIATLNSPPSMVSAEEVQTGLQHI